jgi:hypothetical protein
MIPSDFAKKKQSKTKFPRSGIPRGGTRTEYEEADGLYLEGRSGNEGGHMAIHESIASYVFGS